MDSYLTWNQHVDFIIRKISKGLFLLRRLRTCVGVDVLLKVYYAHIQSVMYYGVLIWGNNSKTVKILLMQKKILRISCRPLFRKMRVLTFPALYVYCSIVFVHCNIGCFDMNIDCHAYNTRNVGSLRVHRYNHTSSQRNYPYMSVKLYNYLPVELRELPITLLKARIKDILINEAIYQVSEYFEIDWKLYV